MSLYIIYYLLLLFIMGIILALMISIKMILMTKERIYKMTISTDLLVAINNLCSGSEIKILLTALSFEPNLIPTSQMLRMTGITKPGNYFRVRKQLLNLGYLIMDDSGMHVNTDKILSDYALLTN